MTPHRLFATRLLPLSRTARLARFFLDVGIGEAKSSFCNAPSGHRCLNSDRWLRSHLEFDLLQPRAPGFSKSKSMVGFMGAFVRCSTVHYAIIQASSKKDHPEGLVIAYPDENCLRDLIAAPSIVGLGFTSREEAMAKLVGSMPAPSALKQRQRPAMPYNVQENSDCEGGFGPTKNHRIVYRILQCTLSAVTVLFYSKNLFSVMLRMALGFSS